MNNYSAIGNLTEKPTLRSTKTTGKQVCNLRIAVNEDRRDPETGEKIHKVEFITATAWDDLATKCSQFEKGTQIYFAGPLNTSTWERTIKTPSGDEIKVPTETKFVRLTDVIFLNNSAKNTNTTTNKVEEDYQIDERSDIPSEEETEELDV